MSPLDYLRRMARPTGRRRASRPQPPRTGEFVPLDDMLRPVEAMVSDIAWCPAEARTTLHSFLATGGRICWTCRTTTVDPTPPGGVE